MREVIFHPEAEDEMIAARYYEHHAENLGVTFFTGSRKRRSEDH